MIAIEVDFNHADGRGQLLLADLAAEYVEGRLVDDPDRGWVGAVDWDTQDKIRAYPSDRSTLLRTAT